MPKPQLLRMQREPLIGPTPVRRAVRPVALVAEHGMSLLGEVHPDLVALPGLERDLKQRRIREAADHLIMSDRQLAGTAGAGALIQILVARQMRPNGAAVAL